MTAVANDPAGVSLSQYAGVHAALGEGFSLETVLLHDDLDPGTWAAADAGWANRIMDDERLQASYDEALLAARDRFWRPVPPVDEDLGAWLDFFRHWSEADDPDEFLAVRHLRDSDLARLHTRWSSRLADDQGVRLEAMDLLGQPPGACPEVAPGISTLPPRQPTPPPVASEPPAATGLDVAAHGAQGATAPSLDVPLPPPPDEPTRRSPRPSPAPRQSSTPPPPVRVSTPPPPSLRVPAPQSTMLTMMAYASLVAELAVSPERAEAALAKFGLSDDRVRAAEDAAWAARLEADPAEREDFVREEAHFRQHWASLRKR